MHITHHNSLILPPTHRLNLSGHLPRSDAIPDLHQGVCQRPIRWQCATMGQMRSNHRSHASRSRIHGHRPRTGLHKTSKLFSINVEPIAR